MAIRICIFVHFNEMLFEDFDGNHWIVNKFPGFFRLSLFLEQNRNLPVLSLKN